MNRIALSFCSFLVLSSSAWAQTGGAPVYDGTAYAPPPPPPMAVPGMYGADSPAPSAAQMEIRMSNIEDELRSLRGRNEELSFQIRRLTETLEKMQRDAEMRFADIEGGRKPFVEPAATAPALADAPAPAAVPAESGFPSSPEGTTGGNGVLKLPDGTETPRDLYNHAFRLLNQTKYGEAAAVFESFTRQHPKDPLIGNAFYWMGETYYIRRDYVTAADHFRAGFEALPSGPKAADNLLKLAMSLSALSRDQEACVVLSQIVTKFKKDSVNVTEKAQQEQKRIGCQ